MTVVDRLVSVEDLRLRLVGERAGLPFLLYRRAGGGLRLVTLRDELARVTVGRAEACDVCLELDPEVSRLHAELQRIAGSWVIADDGLSRNGTFVNGERVRTRCRLGEG